MPDYANVLVKVVAIFGVIKRVPATTPAHTQPVVVLKGGLGGPWALRFLAGPLHAPPELLVQVRLIDIYSR